VNASYTSHPSQKSVWPFGISESITSNWTRLYDRRSKLTADQQLSEAALLSCFDANKGGIPLTISGSTVDILTDRILRLRPWSFFKEAIPSN
jgi:hypothetical protein